MFLFKEIIYIFIGFQIILDMNIGGKMPGSISATIKINIDQGKENYNQEAEAKVRKSSR